MPFPALNARLADFARKGTVGSALVACVGSAGAAQTALLRVSDPLPGGPAGQVIGGFGVTAVNDGLGYACTFTSGGPAGFVQGVWGDLDGGPGQVLRQEATIGNLTQLDLESFFGINRSNVCYSSTVDSPGMGANLDSIWIDDTLLAINGQVIPGTSLFLLFGSRVDITTAGVPYFAAGVSAVSGGASLGRVIFLGSNRVYGFGDAVPNMPASLTDNAIDFDFRFSDDGSHHIAPLLLQLPPAEDTAIAIDGAGLMLAGSLVREGQAVPGALGGPPGAWQRFDFTGITDAGNYMFTGNTDGVTATDEFIVRDGAFWRREGDIVDGEQLIGPIESAALSSTNRLAYVWRIVDADHGAIQALFFESTLLLREGDPVDWDGDGQLDAGTALESFTGVNAISISAAGRVYFTASVNVAGQSRQGFFSIDAPGLGSSYCATQVNSTGQPAAISFQGTLDVSENRAFLRASELPRFAFTFFLVSRDAGFTANPGGSEGNLCLSGAVGRYQNLVQSSGATGTAAIEVDLTQLAQPQGAVPAVAGETWRFTTWFRDQAPGGAPTSNFSNGVEVTFF